MAATLIKCCLHSDAIRANNLIMQNITKLLHKLFFCGLNAFAFRTVGTTNWCIFISKTVWAFLPSLPCKAVTWYVSESVLYSYFLYFKMTHLGLVSVSHSVWVMTDRAAVWNKWWKITHALVELRRCQQQEINLIWLHLPTERWFPFPWVLKAPLRESSSLILLKGSLGGG